MSRLLPRALPECGLHAYSLVQHDAQVLIAAPVLLIPVEQPGLLKARCCSRLQAVAAEHNTGANKSWLPSRRCTSSVWAPIQFCLRNTLLPSTSRQYTPVMARYQKQQYLCTSML